MFVHTPVYLVYGVGLLLSTLFFAQRVYTKLKVVGSVVVEDGLLAAAFVLSVGTQAIGLRMFNHGVAGTHAADLRPWQQHEFALVSPLQCVNTFSPLVVANTIPMSRPWSWPLSSMRRPHASPS